MMLIRFGYDIAVACDAPTPVVTQLTIAADQLKDLRVAEHFALTPQIPSTTYTDIFGNACRRFIAPVGELAMWSDSVIEDSGMVDPDATGANVMPVEALPDDILVYLLGSRYCETDRLSQMAWDLFGATPATGARVQAICDYVNRRIRFDYQLARATRTAAEAHQEQVGVCRDYAHLAIALCRCMNIPARYVNGYLGDIGVPLFLPMDFSAWIEVYLGNRWWVFDPRNNIPRIGRIVISRGRDAADVAMITSFGPHWLNRFRVWVFEVDQPSLDGPIQ
jgi:transglutaminase-like putative cysteine protease